MKMTIAAVVVLLLPFVIFMGTYQELVINGEVVQERDTNFFAPVAALIALAIAWQIAFVWETEQDRQPKWKAVAGLIAVGAVAQGVFGLI
ncbi:MAG: hypothetical protein WBA97_35385 [Actinophytocola sp.]|uniref:hypothetical protein n=1 Tax=Actinophytocola sp. TaxID=1872138 RepID=UPI003C77B422